MATQLPSGLDLSMVPVAEPPVGIIPNFQNPVTLTDAIVAVSATTSVLAIFFLFARLYSTLGVTRSAGIEDATCVLASVFSLAYIGLVVDTKEYSRHIWDLPISYFTDRYFKIIMSETFFGALGLLLSKLSILLLYFRQFSPNKRFRGFICFGIICTVMINITTIIVDVALCAPRQGESFSSLSSIQRCTHLQTWAVVQGSLNILLDFYIVYLPVPVVWSLHLYAKKKIGVLAIFMTGLIACIASILSLVYKARLVRSADALWNSYKVDILNIVEINVSIMVASMPACASLLRYRATKTSIFSSIKSKLFTSRPSSGPAPASDQIRTMSDENHPSGKDRFWRYRNHLNQHSAPPQITALKRQSGQILVTGEFDLFDEKRSSFRESGDGKQTKQSLNSEGSVASPHNMV